MEADTMEMDAVETATDESNDTNDTNDVIVQVGVAQDGREENKTEAFSGKTILPYETTDLSDKRIQEDLAKHRASQVTLDVRSCGYDAVQGVEGFKTTLRNGSLKASL